MKIFGEGKHVSDAERERSIRFAVTESNLHCMTLGLESIAQMDDAIERVMRNTKDNCLISPLCISCAGIGNLSSVR